MRPSKSCGVIWCISSSSGYKSGRLATIAFLFPPQIQHVINTNFFHEIGNVGDEKHVLSYLILLLKYKKARSCLRALFRPTERVHSPLGSHPMDYSPDSMTGLFTNRFSSLVRTPLIENPPLVMHFANKEKVYPVRTTFESESSRTPDNREIGETNFT